MSYISATTEIMYAPSFLRRAITGFLRCVHLPAQISQLAPQFLAGIVWSEALQFLPQLARAQITRFGNNDPDLHDLIAADALLGCGSYALVAQPEFLPALSARGYLQLSTAVNRGHID